MLSRKSEPLKYIRKQIRRIDKASPMTKPNLKLNS